MDAVAFVLDGWLAGALRLVAARGLASRGETIEIRLERVIFFIGVS
jgi:hypothetical protein